MNLSPWKYKRNQIYYFDISKFYLFTLGFLSGLVIFFVHRISFNHVDFKIPKDLLGINIIMHEKEIMESEKNNAEDKFISHQYRKTLELKEGQNLFDLLNSIEEENITNLNSYIFAISKYLKLSSVPIGFSIKAKYSCNTYFNKCIESNIDIQNCKPQRDCAIYQVQFRNSESKYTFKAHPNNSNVIETEVYPLEIIEKVIYIKGTISNSLYYDAESQGVNPTVINSMVRSYGYILDLQRDISKNSKYETLYKEYIDKESNQSIKKYKLMYTNLNINGKDYKIFFFNGKPYNPKGISIIKSLLKTPVDGARISSGFSTGRKHPILGYTRAHKGIDFAAPAGTKIFAAGEGIVTRVAYGRGYGNFIDLKHKNGYMTRYAHMSRYKKGIKVRQRIKQGDVIGYIGMTGLATGPHLHYEILVNGAQVNPMSIKSISTSKLPAREMNSFNYYKKKTQSLIENYNYISN